MAGCNYRNCDVCGGKTFYDANLNYEDEPNEWNAHRPPYKVAGKPQYDTPEKVDKWGFRLDYVGDWCVICNECSKTHRCVIQPIAAAENAGKEDA